MALLWLFAISVAGLVLENDASHLVSRRLLAQCPRQSRPTALTKTEAPGFVEKGDVYTQDGPMRDFFLGIATNGTAWQFLLDAGVTNPPIHTKTKNPKRVVIVGAGIAGLAAAFQLAEAGHEVEIFEGQNRIGGRMMTVSEPFADGLHAEVGAMRLPGENPDDPTGHFLTNYYAKLFRIPHVPFINDDANVFYLMYNERIRVGNWTPQDTLKVWPDWDAELNVRFNGKQRSDLGIKDVTDYWSATLKYAKDELIASPDAAGWQKWVEKWSKLSGYEFLRTDIYQDSTQPRLRPWSSQAITAFSTLAYFPLMNMDMVEILRDDLGRWWAPPMYQFRDGMRALPEAFASQWKQRGDGNFIELSNNIRYGTEVVGIDRDVSGVTVHTRNVASRLQRSVRADAVILTPTLPIIRQIEFNPQLSNQKQDALNNIFYEASVKVLLQTKTRFWEKNGITGGWSKSNSVLGQLHYSRAAQNTPRGLLVCYTWAQDAKVLMALPPDERIRHVISEIAKIHPEIEDEFEVGATHSWLDDRWTQGGWVLFRPFQYIDWFNASCSPEGAIYFAGEASSWSNGWIQGALESATRAAYQFYQDNEEGRILSSVSKQPEMVVVVEQNAGSVAMYEPNGTLISRLNLCLWPHEVEIFPDQRTAIVSCFGLQDYDESIGYPGHSLSVIDLETQTERERIYTTTDEYDYGAPHGVKLRPKTGELFVNVEYPSRQPKIVVFDVSYLLARPKKAHGVGDPRPSVRKFAARPAPLRQFFVEENVLGFDKTFNATSKTHNLLFDEDGSHLFLQTAYGLMKMNPETGKVLGKFLVPFPGIHGAAWMGKFILVSGFNELNLIDPITMRSVRKYDNLGVGQLLYSVGTPNEQWILAVAVWDSTLLVINAQTGRILQRVFVGLDPVHVVSSSDSTHCFVTCARSSGLVRVELPNGASTPMFTGQASGPNGIALAQYWPKFKKDTISLGAAIQLSGADGTSGREFLLGLEFWKESVNGKGGIFVEEAGIRKSYLVDISYEDLQSDISKVYNRTKSLLQRGAKFLFGPYGTDANVEAAKVARDFTVPLLTPGGAGSTVYSTGNGYVFGVLPKASGYLTPVVDILAQQRFPKAASFVILGISDAGAFEDAVATAKYADSKQLKNIGADFVLPNSFSFERGVIKFATGTSNFVDLARLFAINTPSVILVASHAAEAIAITSTLKDHNVSPLGLAFSVGPSLPSFATAFPGYLPLYVMGASPWLQSDTTPGLDRWGSPALFELAFEDRYHTRASYLSAGAAACGTMLEMAICEAGSISPEAVKRSLGKIDTTTSYGRIQIGPSGNNIGGSVHAMQIFPSPVNNLVTGTGTVQKDITATPPVYPFPGWASAFNNASIRGFYWFTKHGGSPFEDFVGTMEFSGDGKFRGNFTIVNSKAAPQDLGYEGTYYFNASGLGQFTWYRASGEELHSHIIGIESSNNLITQLYSSFDQPDQGVLQGRMIYKIPTATLAFTNASMHGTYWVGKAGGELFKDFLGLMSFDGQGNYWGLYSSTNRNGTILPPNSYSGHYAINSDGTGRFVWSNGYSRIVATASKDFEILNMYSAFVAPLGEDGSIQARWLAKRDDVLLPNPALSSPTKLEL